SSGDDESGGDPGGGDEGGGDPGDDDGGGSTPKLEGGETSVAATTTEASDTSAAAAAAAALPPQLRAALADDGGEDLETPAVEAKSALRDLERFVQQREFAQRQANKFAVEYHKKVAIPVACLVFVVIGASLGVRTRRSGYGFAIGVSLLVFTVYYVFLIGGEDLSDRLFVDPWVAMWTPNILFTALGAVLFRRTVQETWGLPFRRRGRRGVRPRPQGAAHVADMPAATPAPGITAPSEQQPAGV
ncbi:MAG: LptF/LptG family permease, partial [Gemmatimonadetes bacterium]|nr:LptF/LptG family permease [Gemmatimonadota bacterium]